VRGQSRDDRSRPFSYLQQVLGGQVQQVHRHALDIPPELVRPPDVPSVQAEDVRPCLPAQVLPSPDVKTWPHFHHCCPCPPQASQKPAADSCRSRSRKHSFERFGEARRSGPRLDMSASSEPAHGAFETPGPIGEVAAGPSRGSRPLRPRDSASTLDMGKHGTKTARYLTEEERKRATELLLAGGKVRAVADVLSVGLSRPFRRSRTTSSGGACRGKQRGQRRGSPSWTTRSTGFSSWRKCKEAAAGSLPLE